MPARAPAGGGGDEWVTRGGGREATPFATVRLGGAVRLPHAVPAAEGGGWAGEASREAASSPQSATGEFSGGAEYRLSSSLQS